MIVNTAEFLPGDFTRNADFSLPTEKLKRAIIGTAGRDRSHFVDATRLATALLGNSIGANMFMLGYAYQNGGLPLSAEAVEKAIEMNGEAVAMNIAAFRYGRRAAVDPAAVESLIAPRPAEENDSLRLSQSFDETIERRVAFLTAYQSARYARQYRAFVDKVAAAEAEKAPGQSALSEAVARYLFKLMAYKDEYEVARLYTDTSFIERVKSTFAAGDLRFEFHLAPPLLDIGPGSKPF
jgi:indolepyruvate ferredoxin oxidoreductase